jgi:hypothetical protein
MSSEPMTLDAQMATFLRTMGLLFEESSQSWTVPPWRVAQVGEPRWTHEELRRMWLQAHGRNP